MESVGAAKQAEAVRVEKTKISAKAEKNDESRQSQFQRTKRFLARCSLWPVPKLKKTKPIKLQCLRADGVPMKTASENQEASQIAENAH